MITVIFKNRFIRFLCTGGLNTVFTYAIYLLCLQVIHYQISYTIAYVSGILLAFFLNRLFVFKTHQGWNSLILFPFVYIFQYLFGILVLWLGVQHLGVDVKLGPLVVILLSVPVTYFLSKLVFVGRKSNTSDMNHAN